MFLHIPDSYSNYFSGRSSMTPFPQIPHLNSEERENTPRVGATDQARVDYLCVNFPVPFCAEVSLHVKTTPKVNSRKRGNVVTRKFIPGAQVSRPLTSRTARLISAFPSGNRAGAARIASIAAARKDISRLTRNKFGAKRARLRRVPFPRKIIFRRRARIYLLARKRRGLTSQWL